LSQAWEKMKGDGLHGTAIVIWTGHSIFDWLKLVRPASPPAVEAAPAAAPLPEPVPASKLLQVQLDAPDDVNYSLLHNDRPLLAKLPLTKLVARPLQDIRVVVELNLGAENYPYRSTHLVLDEPQLAVAPMVRIPLTAALPRSLR